jgi:hypothetical protein
MRGCGKTEKVKKLIADKQRLLIVDTLSRDYDQGVVFSDIAQLRQFWLKVYQQNFRIIYRPPGSDIETVDDIAQLCEMAQACTNLTMVIEELNILFDVTRTPAEFNKLVFGGREPGVTLIGVAQRPLGFGRKLTSQAKEFYVFATREPDDVRYFRYHLGPEAAEQIRTLEQYQYLHWSYLSGVQEYTICKD